MDEKLIYRKVFIILMAAILCLEGYIIFLYYNFYRDDVQPHSNIEYDADTISDINFIKEYDKPVIVVFGADYCPICVNYKPYIKEVNQIYRDEITVKYVDTSVHEDIRKEYNIELIPSTLFFYADGSAYVPTNEIDVDENEEEVNERKYISDKYTIVEGSYFPMAINYKFEYAIDSDGELAYCKYIGLLDMLQLDQIAKDLLKKQHLNLTK